ncbi:TrkA family potassium uptake protein [Pseudomonas sp.]|uniref:potassium channel family protein n=1 Tax=Pseudomonas sp. TaxID=306 RepID=UPI0027377547|nr:potassium channel family protein [Pseudomonas sp.]
MQRIYAAALLLLCMTVIGSLGFYITAADEQANFSDALHMTLITITTVGYGEIIPLTSLGERIFAAFIALTGFGTVTFLFTSLATFFLESDFDYSLRRRRMEKAIKKLSGHYIICGFGRVGRNVAHELQTTSRAFVAIDSDEKLLEEQHEHFPHLLHLYGDATDDDLLLAADIADAAGVFAVTGDDSRNLMIILTARQLNPNIRVVARCHEIRNMAKMKKAGADTVISPDFTGGMRIASSMIRPHVVTFLDEMLRSDHNVRLEEVPISPEHRLLSIGELKQRCPNCVILSIRNQHDFIFNPADNLTLQPGQTLIAMVPPQGRHELLTALS